MSKQSFFVDEHKRKDLEVNKTVRIIDGSSLTSNEANGLYDVYIVNSYPKLTGFHEKLKKLNTVVIETNVKNHICSGVCGNGYIQDTLIQIGNGFFRCNSTHLEII